MMYLLSGQLDGVLGQECREPLAGVMVDVYRPVDGTPVAFRPLTQDEVQARSGRRLAGSVTDDQGRFRIDLDTKVVGYGGGPLEVGLRVLPPGRSATTSQAPVVDCALTTILPAWQPGDQEANAAWRYALPAVAWAQVRAHLGAYVIVGRLGARDGVAAISGARVQAFDVDVVQDDPLGAGITDDDGWFRIDYESAAFGRTPVPGVSFELGGADVYFTADYEGRRLVAEDRSAGRQRDRRDVGPVFCVRLRADVAPLTIVLDSPSPDRITNRPRQPVVGHLSEAARLTLNGRPVEVDGNNRFSAEATLMEGRNTLTLVAIATGSGVRSDLQVTVTLDTAAPAAPDATRITVSVAADGTATLHGQAGAVEPGVTVRINNPRTGASIDVAAAANGGFSGRIGVRPGDHLTVVAVDQAGNSSGPATVRVDQTLPPDPSTVAPPLPTTEFTGVAQATEFLHTGVDPIQVGVQPGTIDPSRAAVVRGFVTDAGGRPLPGSRVTILGRDELGSTRSRLDGMFDLVVNGGGPLVVSFDMDGYLPAQRRVEVPWRSFVHSADVSLVPADPMVTTVDLAGGAGMQAVLSSTSTDGSGSRRAVLLVPAGATATMEFPDGSSQTLTTLDLRITEYSVGDRGPTRMPAELPPGSGYTYAVEFGVDQAVRAGATTVRFTSPVVSYVENFLGFPPGTVVPAGGYDRAMGRWIASGNGRVLTVLAINGATAEVDTSGDNLADDPTVLAALGITDDELAQLARLYAPGQQLWRTPVDHLSPFDCNWPWTGPDAPPIPPGRGGDRIDDGCEIGGSSVLDVHNQVLREDIAIVGTPHRLCYSSDRAHGRVGTRTLSIPLTTGVVPPSLLRVELEVEVAGRRFTWTFAPAPNLRHDFVWDGLDAYGRLLQGAHRARVTVSHFHPLNYVSPDDSGQAFGLVTRSDGGTAVPGRGEARFRRSWQGLVGTFLAPRADGLGGWTLNAHHAYDPTENVLHLGDGTRRNAMAVSGVIGTVAGNGIDGFGGDGGPALQASFRFPEAIAVAADGSLYIVDTNDHRIRRVGPDGTISTVAGTGTRGAGGDGGPAIQADLDNPRDVAVGPDGSLYIADFYNHRVRQVRPDGIMTTVAGTGVAGRNGDGGPATQAELRMPAGVAVAADGTIYVADRGNQRIRRVGTDGRITTLAGSGTIFNGEEIEGGYGGDGGPAGAAELFHPEGIAIGPDDSVVFADSSNNRIRRIGPDGIITTIAGTGTGAFSGDGGPATTANLNLPGGVAVGPDGSVYISDLLNDRFRLIGPDGILTTIAGTGVMGFAGDGGPALAARVTIPAGVALGPDASVYLADAGNRRVRRIQATTSMTAPTDLLVASEDGGEAYLFTASGRHRETVDAITGSRRHLFRYDGAGRLMTVVTGPEAEGNTVRVERDAGGLPTAVVGPDGLRTGLALDVDGYLVGVTNPARDTVVLGYGKGGLLTSYTDPRSGPPSTFAYDGAGRLRRDTNPLRDATTLARIDDADGFTVTRLSPMLRESSYQVVRRPSGDQLLINRCCGLGEVVTQVSADGRRSLAAISGTVRDERIGPDPRWGMQAAPVIEEITTTPSGLRRRRTLDRATTLSDPSDPLTLVRLTERTTVDGRTSVKEFDAARRTYTFTSPEGRTASITVDAAGRVESAQTGTLLPTMFAYDTRGRLASITRGTGADLRNWILRYSREGFLDEVVNPLREISKLAHDPAGRLTAATAPDGTALQFGYDAAGNSTTITPPGRPAHTLDYDHNGDLSVYRPPATASGSEPTVLGYNGDRLLTRISRPGGRVTDVDYDVVGRVSAVRSGRQEIKYEYVPDSRRVASLTTASGSAIVYEYDGEFLTRERHSGPVSGTVEHSYDRRFLVDGQGVGGETPIQLLRDGDGLLTTVGDLHIHNDPETGLRTGATLGGITDTWQHNAFGERRAHSVVHGSTELYSVTYDRDRLGRITGKHETIAGTAHETIYGFDQLGRLQSATIDGAVETYGYDTNGNRTDVTTNASKLGATYDDQDRALTVGDRDLAHGPEGELETVSRPNGETIAYRYDDLGRLIRVDLPDGTRVDDVLDATGRRVVRMVNGTRTSAFLYDGQLHPVAELDANDQVVTRFVYAGFDGAPAYLVKGGRTYRVVADHLGSPRLVVDVATGVILQQLDYDPWGRVVRDTRPGFQPFGFAGGLYDPATGLVHHGARYYDAALGRWTTKDPIGLHSRSANLYAYCGNDPVNGVDRLGLDWRYAARRIILLIGTLWGGEWQVIAEDLANRLNEKPVIVDELRRTGGKGKKGGPDDKDGPNDPTGGSCPTWAPPLTSVLEEPSDDNQDPPREYLLWLLALGAALGAAAACAVGGCGIVRAPNTAGMGFPVLSPFNPYGDHDA